MILPSAEVPGFLSIFCEVVDRILIVGAFLGGITAIRHGFSGKDLTLNLWLSNLWMKLHSAQHESVNEEWNNGGRREK